QEGRQTTPAIVAFDLGSDKKAKRVIKIGRQIAPHYHVRGHLIVWDEFRKDPRFQKQTYNVIYLYNVQTKKIRVLTSKTRYYSPVLSPDLKTIACVEVDQANRCNLVLLNAVTGDIDKHISLPVGTLIQQPQYHDKGQKMVAVAVTEQGTNLVEIDLVRGSLKELFDWSNIQYERPVYHHSSIRYKANYNEKDDIYQLHEGVVTQRTNALFGGFSPFVQDDTIWYNNYTTEGYKISRQPLDSIARTTTPPRSIKTLYAKQNNVDPEPPDSTVRS